MKSKADKVMDLKAAVAALVADGDHISIGGFTINRNPMAAVYEIIRQGRKNLHLYAHSNGQGVDELIGAGCVGRLEIAYAGSGRFAPTCIRFRRAVENGKLKVEDYSNYQMTLRFLAGSMGLPFLPTRSGLGTDILERWGFDRDLRLADEKLPNDKLITIDNPFGNWTETPKLVLVPAINPDVTIIHAQFADCRGNVRIQGLSFADIEQAKAAKKVLVTCEELVEEDFLKRRPEANQLPFIHVDAVVPLAWGAYPTACYGRYDYDPEYLHAYRRAAGNEHDYAEYLREKIIETENHGELLAMAGKNRRQKLTADLETGYARDLARG